MVVIALITAEMKQKLLLSVLLKSSKMKKLSDIIEEIKDTIEWILAGCPKPVPIPVKDDKNDKRRKTTR